MTFSLSASVSRSEYVIFQLKARFMMGPMIKASAPFGRWLQKLSAQKLRSLSLSSKTIVHRKYQLSVKWELKFALRNYADCFFKI
jgi:hypothetical protein